MEFSIAISNFEIYNEKIYDLINNPRLSLETSAKLTFHFVQSPEEILQIISISEAHQRVGATLMNEHSSRSHSIVRISIESTKKDMNITLKSHLDLVDLAGSECAKTTEAKGERKLEASMINKSLLALSKVIDSRTSNNQVKTTYRESKLTLILQDSLGGNSKTAIISTISNEGDQQGVSDYILR
jgi:hypothetical protein